MKKKSYKEDPNHYINSNGEEVIIPKYPTQMNPDEQREYEEERIEYWGVKFNEHN